jgi:hypothetical protein
MRHSEMRNVTLKWRWCQSLLLFIKRTKCCHGLNFKTLCNYVIKEFSGAIRSLRRAISELLMNPKHT